MQEEEQQESTFYVSLSVDQQEVPVPSAAVTSPAPLLIFLIISHPMQMNQGQAT